MEALCNSLTFRFPKQEIRKAFTFGAFSVTGRSALLFFLSDNFKKTNSNERLVRELQFTAVVT